MENSCCAELSWAGLFLAVASVNCQFAARARQFAMPSYDDIIIIIDINTMLFGCFAFNTVLIPWCYQT